MPKSISARIFVALIVVSGFLLVGNAVLNVHSLSGERFAVLLVLATVAARLKVKLPGMTGTMSVNLPFVLLAAALLGTPEAVLTGFISTIAQSLPRRKQEFNLVQLVFNCCAIALAIFAARLAYVSPGAATWIASPALRLALGAAGYFLVNTLSVAIVIALTERVNVARVWLDMVQLSFVYFVASAGVAGLALTVGQEIGWQVPMGILPVMVGVYLSYRRYFAVAAVAAERVGVGAAGVTAGAHV